MRSKSRAKRSNTEPQPSHRGLYQHYRPKADSVCRTSNRVRLRGLAEANQLVGQFVENLPCPQLSL
jgi:hypothetical protein